MSAPDALVVFTPSGRRGRFPLGSSLLQAARSLGVVDQTLFNWVKAHRVGKLTGVDSKAVSAEQMEISRLRAELARVKMERDIRGKARAYFAKERK